jgi:hypothetical protein
MPTLLLAIIRLIRRPILVPWSKTGLPVVSSTSIHISTDGLKDINMYTQQVEELGEFC